MAKCETYNFVVKKGSTTVFTVEYVDSAGVVKDLTNYSARMQIRTDPSSDTVALSLNSSTATANKSILDITPLTGQIEVYISAADTMSFTREIYFYDLEIFTATDPYSKSDSEYVERLLEGTFVTTENVTR